MDAIVEMYILEAQYLLYQKWIDFFHWIQWRTKPFLEPCVKKYNASFTWMFYSLIYLVVLFNYKYIFFNNQVEKLNYSYFVVAFATWTIYHEDDLERWLKMHKWACQFYINMIQMFKWNEILLIATWEIHVMSNMD
jgi:hypothetical protein